MDYAFQVTSKFAETSLTKVGEWLFFPQKFKQTAIEDAKPVVWLSYNGYLQTVCFC
jgi:hypothetical protein